ncbi:MAG: hypothetical protein GTO18_06695 [Anaerolineales bacterium]|nr:hypothetical protein [Anaerolineales bacterium]
MEKVISEIKMIETDDGYRIEIKGDKEKIKSFMKDYHRYGRRGRGGFPRWGGPWGHGGFGMHPFMMKMGSCFGPWDIEDEEEDTEESD